MAGIGRDEVLHTAALALIALSEQEATALEGELSQVLEHVARIGELDLSGVEPTAHVVEIAGDLRPDEPQHSLAREVVLEPAPEDNGEEFLVPSPTA